MPTPTPDVHSTVVWLTTTRHAVALTTSPASPSSAAFAYHARTWFVGSTGPKSSPLSVTSSPPNVDRQAEEDAGRLLVAVTGLRSVTLRRAPHATHHVPHERTSPPDVDRWNAARSNRAIDGARYELVTFGALSFDAWPPT